MYPLQSWVHKRAVNARLWHDGHDQLAWRGYSDDQLANYISSFKPTWIVQLIWLSRESPLADSHISRWNKIRTACLSKNKCVFVFMLNFNDYVGQSKGTLTSKFDEINMRLGSAKPDGWLFDFLGPATRKQPEVVLEAISSAHDREQFVGGNIWGAKVLEGLDYVCVVDGAIDTGNPPTLQWDENIIRKYHNDYPSLPIHFHTADNPQNDPSHYLCAEASQWFDAIEAACTFKCEYGLDQRKAYVLDRAQHQEQSKVTYEYNLFFPTCPIFRSYDSLGDGDMQAHILSLMETYNPV